MNKIQEWLGPGPARIALFLYLLVGLVQLGTIPAGLNAWTGLHWMLGVMCAAVLAWIPFMGQAVGLAAAVNVLHWPVVPAAVLFLWPIWFFGAVFLLKRVLNGRGAGGTRGDSVGRRFGSIKKARPPSSEGVYETEDDIPPHARVGTGGRYRPAA